MDAQFPPHGPKCVLSSGITYPIYRASLTHRQPYLVIAICPLEQAHIYGPTAEAHLTHTEPGPMPVETKAIPHVLTSIVCPS